jgi:hypothetical protein
MVTEGGKVSYTKYWWLVLEAMAAMAQANTTSKLVHLGARSLAQMPAGTCLSNDW